MEIVVPTLCIGWCLRAISGTSPLGFADFVAGAGAAWGAVYAYLQLGL